MIWSSDFEPTEDDKRLKGRKRDNWIAPILGRSKRALPIPLMRRACRRIVDDLK